MDSDIYTERRASRHWWGGRCSSVASETSKRVATMKVDKGVSSIAVSDRFIAAESLRDTWAWDATTYKQVFVCHNESPIWNFDFSADSTQLVCADGHNCMAMIWDIVAQKGTHTRPSSRLAGQRNIRQER